MPPLFDLERVEVLRGPQGTLFGGGSEGGTIRYIQASPGLTDYSTYARAQWLDTEGGDPSYEAGVAFGGPIIEDKLGFRASIFGRKTGGYIDLTDYRNGQVYDENANNGKVRMGRVAAHLDAHREHRTDGLVPEVPGRNRPSRQWLQPVRAGRLVVDPLCFNIPYILSQPVASRAFLVPPGRAARPIRAATRTRAPSWRRATPSVRSTSKRFQSLALGQTPTRSDVEIGSANFQWDLNEGLQLTSVTSFTQDSSTGQSPQNFPITLFVLSGHRAYRHAGPADDHRADRFGIQSERHGRSERPGPGCPHPDQHGQPAQCVLAGSAARVRA